MNNLFIWVRSFKGDISKWFVTRVTDMRLVFRLTYMNEMFMGAFVLKQKCIFHINF